jgi:uncharacterized protein (DUF488 family)
MKRRVGDALSREARVDSRTPVLSTIGYEAARMDRFLHALLGADIDLLIDVRAVAGSRRPGFAKSSLAAHLAEAGIDYLHLRGLGTPTDGRAAARRGEHLEMRRIYLEKVESGAADADLETLLDLLARRRVAILCYERDPTHCHRSIVAELVVARMPVTIRHLIPEMSEPD